MLALKSFEENIRLASELSLSDYASDVYLFMMHIEQNTNKLQALKCPGQRCVRRRVCVLGDVIPGCLGAESCSYAPGPGTPVTPVFVNDIMKTSVT
jgi:hypothetical protein